MNRITSAFVGGLTGAIIAAGVMHMLTPKPVALPAPPSPIALGDVRALINVLKPAAYDALEKYPSLGEDYTVKSAHENRVRICVAADDSVDIAVATGLSESVRGTGKSLREAENDLGKKTSELAKLLN